MSGVGGMACSGSVAVSSCHLSRGKAFVLPTPGLACIRSTFQRHVLNRTEALMVAQDDTSPETGHGQEN